MTISLGACVFAMAANVAPEPEATTASAESPSETTAASSAVPDSTWSALVGKQVAIETSEGTRKGELTAADGDHVVLIEDDGTVTSVPKRDASGVKVTQHAPTPAPAAAKTEKNPADAKPPEAPPADAPKDEKKSKREHALLGAFTAHGGAYANWRGDGVRGGGGAYLMDWGIGINATPGFGMYAMAGGVLGARIDDKTIRANAGHLNLMFAFGGKYYHSMFGAGLAMSRLKLPAGVQKDLGLSLPLRMFGKLPLPHHLYLGIGIAYELMLVRDWKRFVNVIGGQIILGRW
ncbi:MAG TPA: hypothetical protein VG755_23425 [Nannocystaceae bacterium]|nr:hypothetical protein [Nannocystaceae bacterium]